MREFLAVGLALLGLGLLIYFRHNRRLRQQARSRLDRDLPREDEETTAHTDSEPPLFRSYTWLAIVAGLVVFLICWFGFDLGFKFAMAFALISALLLWRLELWWQTTRRARIEEQLADALDLMISVLRSGGSVLEALEVAARESRRPLGTLLQEMVARIRYGDDPKEVMQSLQQRVPLETFALFGAALMVHWEVGGSLAPVLATVARTVRDRLELGRRVRALTTQSRFSIAAVMAVTYFLALVVWRNDPGRMEAFVGTNTGQSLITFAMVLQALGIVWASSMSKLKY